jgi:hypothetical protein
LIANSHGYGDLNVGEAYLAIALARRGFVVASPTFPLTNTGAPGGLYLADAANQPADVRLSSTRCWRFPTATAGSPAASIGSGSARRACHSAA